MKTIETSTTMSTHGLLIASMHSHFPTQSIHETSVPIIPRIRL